MSNPKPIIILSYFFPPCNLTPSERVFSWAKYLKKANYYPIIITRNWDVNILNATTDVYKPSGKKVVVETHQDYEVHYIPYKQNLKDKLFNKYYGKSLYPIYLMMAFIWHILQLPFIRLSSVHSISQYANKLLSEKKNIYAIIATVAPFELLGVAHQLSKKYNVQWIADYRDDWSTNEMQYVDSFPKRILRKYNSFYEARWLKNVSFIISVSEYYVQKLSKFSHKKGILVENGFEIPENIIANSLFDKFTITYLGSLYTSQNIEMFLDVYKHFIDLGNKNIQLIFVGLGSEPPIRKRIESYMNGYEPYYTITSRISKKEALELQLKSHLLLAVSYGDKKGIPSSKLYDYIATKKRVLICPSDSDVIEDTLSLTKQGIVCNSPGEILHQLNALYYLFTKNELNDSISIPPHVYNKFSREFQTNNLIIGLNTLNS
jgi:glycosyltransferase involved in cell wall biosynthesis